MRRKMIVNSLVMLLFTALCCEKAQRRDNSSLQLQEPSKISDVLSVLSLSSGEKDLGLNRDDLTYFLNVYFQELSKQNIISVSAYIAEDFTSPAYRNKKIFVMALKTARKRQRILRMRPTMEAFLIFDSYALVKVKLDEVRAYLKSGFILDDKRELLIRIVKAGQSLKIQRIIMGKDMPLSGINEGHFEDPWLHYRVKLLSGYELFSSDYAGVLQHIAMYSKSEPTVISLSAIWSKEKDRSAFSIAERDRNYLKNENGFAIIHNGKCSHKGHDCAQLDFSYLEGDERIRERRIYFWRYPIIYGLVLQSPEGDVFEGALGDFLSVLGSFEFMKTEEDFDRIVDPGTVTIGNTFKSSLYGVQVEAPVDWEIGSFMHDLVQFVWLHGRKDTLAYFHVSTDEDRELKEVTSLYDKARQLLFKYRRILDTKDTVFNSVPAIRESSRFKRSLFSGYANREEIVFGNKGRIYTFGIVSKRLSKKELKEQFGKFLGGITIP